MGVGGTMDSCGRCMKFSLICINVVTFIGGLLALALGAWVWMTRSFSSTLMSNNMFIASVGVVVATGAAVMLLALLGCCGAAKEVKCMLLTYYILVFIIFVLMLVGGILQFVFRAKVLSTLDREMYASIPYYGVRPEYTRAWDDTQTYLQCCGVHNYKDWNGNVPESCCKEVYPGKVSYSSIPYYGVRPEYTRAWDDTQTYLQCCGVHNYKDWNGNVPESCCKEVYPGKRMDCKYSGNPATMYMDGCLPQTVAFLRENAVYVGVIAIIVAFIMLLGLILSCGLFVKIE